MCCMQKKVIIDFPHLQRSYNPWLVLTIQAPQYWSLNARGKHLEINQCAHNLPYTYIFLSSILGKRYKFPINTLASPMVTRGRLSKT